MGDAEHGVDVYRATPNAFSRFTFEKSAGRLQIVDIQGVDDIYTDPQIHSIDSTQYGGEGNLGIGGASALCDRTFCNGTKRSLGTGVLTHHNDEAKGSVGCSPEAKRTGQTEIWYRINPASRRCYTGARRQPVGRVARRE